MTILMTGATGLVGERLLPRLVANGENCRILVRPGKSGPAGVQAVEGDLLNPASRPSPGSRRSCIWRRCSARRTPT